MDKNNINASEIIAKIKKILFNQKGIGFISVIIVAIFLVAIITVSINNIGKSNTVDISDYAALSYASLLISQGGNIGSGINLLSIKNYNIDDITFNNHPEHGLFSGIGGIGYPVPPNESIDNSFSEIYSDIRNKWIYRKIKIHGVGTDEEADYIAILPGIKSRVCDKINKSLYGENFNENSFIAVGSSIGNFLNNVNDMTGFKNLDDVIIPCDFHVNISSDFYVNISTILIDFLGVKKAYARTLSGGEGGGVPDDWRPENNYLCDDTVKMALKEGCMRTSDGYYIYFYILKEK